MTVEQFIDDDDDTVEVELAGAWERVGAHLLNNVFTFIAAVPIGIGAAMSKDAHNLSGVFWLSILVFIAYGVYQVWLMSTTGQSLGKKLLGLRVVKTTGEEVGFVNVVLLREVVYGLGVGVLTSVFSFMGDAGNAIGTLVSLGIGIANIVMLFSHSERRVLWDMVADTVVIKLPR